MWQNITSVVASICVSGTLMQPAGRAAGRRGVRVGLGGLLRGSGDRVCVRKWLRVRQHRHHLYWRRSRSGRRRDSGNAACPV